MWYEIIKILLCFPSSYLVEFRFMTKRKRKTAICIGGDIKHQIFKPNIKVSSAQNRKSC